MKPFMGCSRSLGSPKNGVLLSMRFCVLVTFATSFCLASPVLAGDGATEALELRVHAERAIAQEQAAGHAALAEAMQGALAGLLQEYLVTHDGTIALDTVDAAFVQAQFTAARAMEDPGVALALDVFAGPGTGFEHDLQNQLADLASFDGVQEAAFDAHERVMERQLEKVEQHAAKMEDVEAKLDAKMAAAAERLEIKAEVKAEKVEDKAEAKAEKAEEKAEVKAEKAEDKAENDNGGKKK